MAHELPTYYDVAKRLDPDGGIARVVELLSQDNPILEDAFAMEGNLVTGHRTTVRTGLPTPQWRLLNYGVQIGKSKTQQVEDACGTMAKYSQIDVKLAKLNNNSAAWRLSEDKPFMEAFGQEAARVLVYGDKAAEPAAYHGLSPRYTVAVATSGIGKQVVDGGGTGGDNTSAWFHTWGENASFLTFPKGSMAGITVTDKGQVTADDGGGGFYEAYRTYFEWDIGFVLRDYRYTSVLRNIDVSSILALDAGGATARGVLIQQLIIAYNRCKKTSGGRRALYTSENVKTALDLAVNEKNNVNLTTRDYNGAPTTHFYEVPVRVCDAILETEGDLVP